MERECCTWHRGFLCWKNIILKAKSAVPTKKGLSKKQFLAISPTANRGIRSGGGAS